MVAIVVGILPFSASYLIWNAFMVQPFDMLSRKVKIDYDLSNSHPAVPSETCQCNHETYFNSFCLPTLAKSWPTKTLVKILASPIFCEVHLS